MAMMFDEGKYRDNSFFNLLDMFFDPEAVHGRVQKLYGAVLEGGILETI